MSQGSSRPDSSPAGAVDRIIRLLPQPPARVDRGAFDEARSIFTDTYHLAMRESRAYTLDREGLLDAHGEATSEALESFLRAYLERAQS